MEHFHSFKAENNVHTYERKYLGEGRYFQRGLCAGIEVGDDFVCFLAPRVSLRVDKIISKSDSKGKFENAEDASLSLYEAELVDDSFKPGMAYTVLSRI